MPEARISCGMPADHDDIKVDLRALFKYSGFGNLEQDYLILNGNASLCNFIKRENLHPSEPAASPSMKR